MAHKGRGIFLVYVDIDAKDAKEFNELTGCKFC